MIGRVLIALAVCLSIIIGYIHYSGGANPASTFDNGLGDVTRRYNSGEIPLPPSHQASDWWIANHGLVVSRDPESSAPFVVRDCRTCHRTAEACSQCHRFVGAPMVRE